MICMMFTWDTLRPQHPVVLIFFLISTVSNSCQLYLGWWSSSTTADDYVVCLRWLETTTCWFYQPFHSHYITICHPFGWLKKSMFGGLPVAAIPGLAKHGFRDHRSSDIWPGGLRHRCRTEGTFIPSWELRPIWGFPSMGIPKTWFITMENPIKMDPWGVLLFQKPPYPIAYDILLVQWNCTRSLFAIHGWVHDLELTKNSMSWARPVSNGICYSSCNLQACTGTPSYI